MLATDNLGAVSRTVLETIRTLMVWLLNLLLYYAGRLADVQCGQQDCDISCLS